MKPGKTLGIGIFAALIMFIIATHGLCEGVKQEINKEDAIYTNPEKTIRCKAGSTFSIVLDSNPTTGYQWQLADSRDGRLLKFINSRYRASKTDLAGAGGKETWSFKALSAGQTTIIFEYLRPWEKNKEPAKKTVFKINIQ
jgi:predicted secreted protein